MKRGSRTGIFFRNSGLITIFKKFSVTRGSCKLVGVLGVLLAGVGELLELGRSGIQ